MKIITSEGSKADRCKKNTSSSSFDIIISNGKISNASDIIISFMVLKNV